MADRPVTFEYTLPSEKKVEIRELGPEDELAVFTLIGEQVDTHAGKVKLAHALLRRAIYAIDGVPQTYEMLEENKLYRAFSARDFKLLQEANNQVNGPLSKEELDSFLKTRSAKA